MAKSMCFMDQMRELIMDQDNVHGLDAVAIGLAMVADQIARVGDAFKEDRKSREDPDDNG